MEIRRLEDDGNWSTLGVHPARYLTLLPENLWAFLLRDDADILLAIADRCPPLDSHPQFEPVASTTAAEAELYGVSVREFHLATSPGWRVLNTGVIEAYAPAWGLERLSHGGMAFLRPVLPRTTPDVSTRRRDFYDAPKLVFKKLCSSLTASVDRDGSYAGLNVNFVVTTRELVTLLGAIMNSSLMRWVYEGYFGALRMSGGYMQVQAPQLRVLPLADRLFTEGNPLSDPLLAQLAEAGATLSDIEQERMDTRIAFMATMAQLLGLSRYRDAEPSWVMPRQAAILAAVEDTSSDHFDGFWAPLRLTARQLHVDITVARLERELVAAVQNARAAFAALGVRASSVREGIDAMVFDLYGLSASEIVTVTASAGGVGL